MTLPNQTSRTPSGRKPRHDRSRVTVGLASLIVASLLMAPAAAQTKDDVEEAETARDQAAEVLEGTSNQLQAAIRAYQEISAEVFELQDSVRKLQARLARDSVEQEALEEATRNLAFEAYVANSGTGVGLFMQASSVQDFIISNAMLERANKAQSATQSRFAAVSKQVERLLDARDVDLALLEEQQAAATEAQAEIDQLFHDAQEDFQEKAGAADRAKSEYEAEQRRLEEEARRREEERRKKREGGGGVVGGLVCPQAQPLSFINDWGFPRSGGRTHQGTDIFSAYNTPVYAVADGVLRAREGGIGGITIWLTSNDGDGYYYAHLSGWAPGIKTGSRVSQGQEIGYVGDSGNAKGTPPHTHFQIHPGNGSAVNPYPTLLAICDRG